MKDILTITCNDNGTYDINPVDFTCTNPCQPPELPDPEIMEHDWIGESSDLAYALSNFHIRKCYRNGLYGTVAFLTVFW